VSRPERRWQVSRFVKLLLIAVVGGGVAGLVTWLCTRESPRRMKPVIEHLAEEACRRFAERLKEIIDNLTETFMGGVDTVSTTWSGLERKICC